MRSKAKAKLWQKTCSSLSPKTCPREVFSLLCSISGSPPQLPKLPYPCRLCQHIYSPISLLTPQSFFEALRKLRYCKLLRLFPDKHMVKMIMELVRNRSFTLTTGDSKQSRLRRLKNGVPQGSVLAPLLFNIYMYDLPSMISRKFAYADDLALLHSSRYIEENVRFITPLPASDLGSAAAWG